MRAQSFTLKAPRWIGLATCLAALFASPAWATTYSVSNATSLQSAIDQAVAGDVIQMLTGTYTGQIKIFSRSGAKSTSTVNNLITITGPADAVITTGSTTSGYALYIQDSKYWKITGISIKTALKGVMMDNSSNIILDNLTVSEIGQEAVHFRKNTYKSLIRNSRISNTGKKDLPYGEAVYVGSANSNWASVTGSSSTADGVNDVCIASNTFGPNVAAEAIDVKEGTNLTYIFSNTFDLAGISGYNYADSAADLKGQNIYVYKNTIKNTTSTYLANVYDGGTTVKDTTVVPEAFQTHQVTNAANAPSGTNIWVWANTADMKSATRPSGYGAAMMFHTDGNGSNYYCSLPTANTVASGDLGSNLSATDCTTVLATARTTCPAYDKQ